MLSGGNTLLSSRQTPSSSKVIHADRVQDLVGRLRQSPLRIVFTNGCFDLLHIGHVDYLEKAKMLGDLLIVGVNTDESIAQIKGPSRPIVELNQRMRILASLSCVDYVIPFAEATPLRLIELLSPHILVKGADYAEDTIVGAQHVKKLGGFVQTIELVPGVSTSKIVERIHGSES